MQEELWHMYVVVKNLEFITESMQNGIQNVADKTFIASPLSQSNSPNMQKKKQNQIFNLVLSKSLQYICNQALIYDLFRMSYIQTGAN